MRSSQRTRWLAWVAFVGVGLLGLPAAAQESPREATIDNTVTTITVGAGFDGRFTYRWLEAAQVRKDRWIFPDVVYFDYGDAVKHRELWVGGGVLLAESSRLTAIAGSMLAFATGREATGAVYVDPYAFVAYRITSRLRSRLMYLLVVPVSSGGTWLQLLDRAQLEYRVGSVHIGAGYAGSREEGESWVLMPFVSVSVAPRVGDIELRVGPRVADGHGRPHFQLRYAVNLN